MKVAQWNRRSSFPSAIRGLFSGFLRGRGECFLIYDFVPSGNLLQYLDVKDGDGEVLEWSTRVSIVKGIANDISFLHAFKPNKPAFAHQNISAEKILIDQRLFCRTMEMVSRCRFPRNGTPAKKGNSQVRFLDTRTTSTPPVIFLSYNHPNSQEIHHQLRLS